jgi:hypothetical protein
MSQAEHYYDAYGGRADWSLDGPRYQASGLTKLTVRWRVSSFMAGTARVTVPKVFFFSFLAVFLVSKM